MFPKDFETPKNLQVQSNKFGMKGFDEMMKMWDIIQKGDWENSCIFVENQAEVNIQ